MRSVILLILASAFTAESFVRVCYYTNWAQYRKGLGAFVPEDIDPLLCTHIVYAFNQIERGTHKMVNYEDNDNDLFVRVNNLKKANPELKTLIAVGGWAHEDTAPSKFSEMVQTQANRKIFIDSALKTIKQYGFDGLDLDWEYPTQRGSRYSDRETYITLCEEIMVAFKAEAAASGNPRLLLTMAVPAARWIINEGYLPGKLAPTIDWINLMSYDLHGPWETKTGHHTGMADPQGLSVPEAVKNWMSKGMPANQIALGIGLYGRSFGLSQASSHGIGAGTTKYYGPKALPGQYTGESGFLSYYEICQLPFNIVRDATVGAPYGYYDKQWVGYDDQISLLTKINQLIKGKGLRGAMFWAIDLDDFNGQFCGMGKYPLMNFVKDHLEGTSPNPATPTPPGPTVSPPVTSPVTPSTQTPTTVSTNGPTQPPTATTAAPPNGTCKAIGAWSGNANMDAWCQSNCALGNCPASMCKCS